LPSHPADLLGRLRPAAASNAKLALEAVLAAALGVAVARLAWIALTPQGPFGTPQGPAAAAGPADLSILTRFDPFSRAAPAAQPNAAAGFGLRLFGVRSGSAGASAIIAGPDGRQQVFAVGEEVAPGVVLQAVAEDHVSLKSPAGLSTLTFPAPTPSGPVAMPQPAPPPAPAVANPPAEPPPGSQPPSPAADAAPPAAPAT